MSDEKDKKAEPPAPGVAAPPGIKRSVQAIVICVVAAASLTAADLWSKSWASERLSHARLGDAPEVCATDDQGFVRYQRIPSGTIAIATDVLELEYAENCGAAFGLLRQAPTVVRIVVFSIAAIAATCVLLWLFAQGRGGPFFAVSVPLVISGAIGNLHDRVLNGYVVDFIHFHYEHPILWMDRFDYPTFNVADIAITIGVILLLIDGMRGDAKAPVTKGEGESKRDAGNDASEEEEGEEEDEAETEKSESRSEGTSAAQP